MSAIVLEKRYRVIVSDKPVKIVLVGAGGTGSQIAVNMARLMYHAQESGVAVEMVIIDHDTVEPSNVGRQQFAPTEVGQFKSVALARRLNNWLGLRITAVASPFPSTIHEAAALFYTGNLHTLIIGAVDNEVARQHICQITENWPQSLPLTWIDCGNDEWSGQVLTGHSPKPVEWYEFSPLGTINALPFPSIQAPALLEPPPITAVVESCAELVEAGRQSLLINQLVANVASQQVADIILRREISTFASYVNLQPPTVSSQPITVSALRDVVGDKLKEFSCERD